MVSRLAPNPVRTDAALAAERARAFFGTAASIRPHTADERGPVGFSAHDIWARGTPANTQRLALDADARLTELSLADVVGQYYRDFQSSRPYTEHLAEAMTHTTNVAVRAGIQTFKVPSTVASKEPANLGVIIPKLQDKSKPVVIYLDDATATPFDDEGTLSGSFASLLAGRTDVTAVGVRTPGQNEGLAGYKDATAIENVKSNAAAVVKFNSDLIKAFRDAGYENIYLCGYSVGGLYANLTRAACDDGSAKSCADGYITMCSPPHLGFLYADHGWWEVLLPNLALEKIDDVVAQLSVPADTLMRSEHKTIAIFGSNDEIVQRGEDAYPATRVRFMPGGHISGITEAKMGGTLDFTRMAFFNAVQELAGDKFAWSPRPPSRSQVPAPDAAPPIVIPRGWPDAKVASAKGVVPIGDRFPELAGGCVIETFNAKPGTLPDPSQVSVVFAEEAGKATDAARRSGGLVVRVTPPMRGENIVLEAEADTPPLQIVSPSRLGAAMAYAADKYLAQIFGGKAPSFAGGKPPALFAEAESAAPALTLAVPETTLVEPIKQANPFAATGVPQAMAAARQAREASLAAAGFSAPVRAAMVAGWEATGQAAAEAVEAATRLVNPLLATAAGAAVPQTNRLGRSIAALDEMTVTPPEWVVNAGPAIVDRWHKGRASWVVGADATPS